MEKAQAFLPFEPAAETWDSFLERFECFLHSQDYVDLPASRKRGYFLSLCGREVFATARVLAAPSLVFEMPWDVLLAKLRSHYSPTPSRIARRFAFRRRVQRPGESINDYMASLRSAALYCEFPELDDVLLDQLVAGTTDLRLQRRLLARSDITLATALFEAQAAELAEKSAAEIQRFRPPETQAAPGLAVHHGEAQPSETPYGSSDEDDDVRRLKSFPRRGLPAAKSSPLSCAGCGGSHGRADCRFKNAVCRRCGKRGHLARVCRAGLPMADSLRDPAPRRKSSGLPATRKDDCFAVGHATVDPLGSDWQMGESGAGM
ncbi:uncharacterized protein LOC131196030 [Ahaetulla prasina]|uniref:uncharacterized protein LOC131196030 n=1 Tax=Ahaetulla prasina TaxID=499056 RepID=UPI0026471634|nr:uncharacterized protein LOC131196030 [Ahaetulla prasina]